MAERCNCIFQQYCDAKKSVIASHREDLILAFHEHGELSKEILAAAGIKLPGDRRPRLAGDEEFSITYAHWRNELVVHRWKPKRTLQALLYLVEIEDQKLEGIEMTANRAQEACAGPQGDARICSSSAPEVIAFQSTTI